MIPCSMEDMERPSLDPEVVDNQPPPSANLVEHAVLWIAQSARAGGYDDEAIEEVIAQRRQQFATMSTLQMATGILFELDEHSMTRH